MFINPGAGTRLGVIIVGAPNQADAQSKAVKYLSAADPGLVWESLHFCCVPLGEVTLDEQCVATMQWQIL